MNERVRVAILAKRLAQLRDGDREIRVLDNRLAPDRLHQPVALQDCPRILDQDGQDLECLWRKRDDFAVAKQPASIGIELETFKSVHPDTALGRPFHTVI